MTKEETVKGVGPKIRNGEQKVLIFFKGGQRKGQGIRYAHPLPEAKMGLGNPAFRGIGPGPEAVGPNTKVYGLINEGNPIGFVGDKITRGFKGLRAQAKGSRVRRMMK